MGEIPRSREAASVAAALLSARKTITYIEIADYLEEDLLVNSFFPPPENNKSQIEPSPDGHSK
jgi:hypothetical protein